MGKVHENGAGRSGSLCKYECIFLNMSHSLINLREFTLTSDELQSVTKQTKRQSSRYKQMYQNNLNTEAKSLKAQSGKILHIQPLGLHQSSGEDAVVEKCSPRAASLHEVT